MTKRKRILLIITGIIVVIILILSFYANSIVKTKIEALIKDKMPAHIETTYKDIKVNVLGGTVTVKEPILFTKVKDSSLIHTQLEMKSLVIGNISYWDYSIISNYRDHVYPPAFVYRRVCDVPGDPVIDRQWHGLRRLGGYSDYPAFIHCPGCDHDPGGCGLYPHIEVCARVPFGM